MHAQMPADPNTATHPARARFRRARLWAPLLLALFLFGAAACSDDEDAPAANGDGESQAAAATGETLTAEEIYRRVSPAVAFISTPDGTGSGIQIDERHVLTNAHVLWPHRSARVVFPDGSEFTDASVVGWDLLADTAVIDLGAAAPAEAAAIGTAADFAPGAPVYLIGYPAEIEEFPQPTITGGLLSRFREWSGGGFSYIQTDASIAGGQSGGALVAADGTVIGISGFSFSDAGFGIVADIAAALVGAQTILDGGEPSPVGQRVLPTDSGAREHRLTLDNFYEERAYILHAAANDEILISAESDADIFFSVSSIAGVEIIYVDATIDGREETVLFIPDDGDYLVIVGQYGIDRAVVVLESETPLAPLPDPDDGTILRPGTTHAAIDYLGDVDQFEIDLEAGVEVTITVGSPNIDALATLDHPLNEFDVLATDDDSGGGLFGVDARLTFTPDRTDRYLLSVSDALRGATGGYLIHVE